MRKTITTGELQSGEETGAYHLIKKTFDEFIALVWGGQMQNGITIIP